MADGSAAAGVGMKRSTRLTAADLERLATWQIEITETLRERVRWTISGDEHKARGLGGRTINIRHGCWFGHADGKGGGALQLIRYLKGCSPGAAVEWAEAWLRSHAGIGRAGAIGD